MTRGGKRNGAGRPKGSNLYGEKTQPVRIPVSQVERVLRFVRERENQLPLYACGVSAGFPSPADDYLEGSLDLNTHLVREPNATFFVRANGELTVKRFRKEKGKSWLMPENSKFQPILLREEDDTHLWGVVTSVIHSL